MKGCFSVLQRERELIRCSPLLRMLLCRCGDGTRRYTPREDSGQELLLHALLAPDQEVQAGQTAWSRESTCHLHESVDSGCSSHFHARPSLQASVRVSPANAEV